MAEAKNKNIVHDDVEMPSITGDREIIGWLLGLSLITRTNAKGVPTQSAAAMVYAGGVVPSHWGPMSLSETEGGGTQSGCKAMTQCFKVSFRGDEDVRRIQTELGGALNDEALAFPRPVKMRIANEKPVADARNPETRCEGRGIKIGAPVQG